MRDRPHRRLAGAGFILLMSVAVWSARADETADLADRVSRAFASSSSSALTSLFPSDRKVAVTLDRIADLRGFVGAGPLVEAVRRYLDARTEIRFESAPPPAGGRGSSSTSRVKGTLVTRDGSGRKERVGLVFTFERIDGAWRATEVRETG